jgi:hypothetical protein
MSARNPMDKYLTSTNDRQLTGVFSFREMMRQRGAGGGAGGGPKLPRGSLGLGGLVIVGGIAIAVINASIFNGLNPLPHPLTSVLTCGSGRRTSSNQV